MWRGGLQVDVLFGNAGGRPPGARHGLHDGRRAEFRVPAGVAGARNNRGLAAIGMQQRNRISIAMQFSRVYRGCQPGEQQQECCDGRNRAQGIGLGGMNEHPKIMPERRTGINRDYIILQARAEAKTGNSPSGARVQVYTGAVSAR